MSLALWLRAGRTHRGLGLDDVAKVTKIQARILERLEAGKFDGLPADVFVRGFVRSFARCVGLDEAEALRRYAACGLGASSPLTPTVRALVDAMVDLAPGSATAPRATPRRMQAIEVVDFAAGGVGSLPGGSLVETLMVPEASTLGLPQVGRAHEPAPAAGATSASSSVEAPCEAPAAAAAAGEAKKKRGRRGKNRHKRAATSAGLARDVIAVGTPPAASPVVVGKGEPIATETWSPKMPSIATAPSVPWRKPAYAAAAAAATAVVVPSLVIDDADPDSAERLREERAEPQVPRRSFLPPILLDREDRSARQGGLTLAVIILLIAATLTLSYLMRRPSASGDGMTRLEVPAGAPSMARG